MGVYDIDWDLLLRRRFMNWDAEVAPNDSYTKKLKKKSKKKKNIKKKIKE